MKLISREIELLEEILQDRMLQGTNEIEDLEIAVILGKLEGEKAGNVFVQKNRHDIELLRMAIIHEVKAIKNEEEATEILARFALPCIEDKIAQEAIKDAISKIPVNRANFEHIAQTGVINGSLFVSIKEVIKKVIKVVK